MMRTSNPGHILRRLYRDRHGYDETAADRRTLKDAGSDAMYGELMPSATEKLFEEIGLGRKDVLYDLGSGVGKVVLQAAITRPLQRVVGIELAQSRHDVAVSVLEEVEAQGLLVAETCELWCTDFMRARMADATVVYTCSTAFPLPLMRRLVEKLARLSPNLLFVSLQPLETNPHFRRVEVLKLDTSWKRGTKVYIYRRKRQLRSNRRSIIVTASGL